MRSSSRLGKCLARAALVVIPVLLLFGEGKPCAAAYLEAPAESTMD